jgi:hypothetical protein
MRTTDSTGTTASPPTTTTAPSPATSPERRPTSTSRPRRAAPHDAPAPAESVRISDCPVGHGRAYLIERELHTKAELDALVTDYLHRASELGEIPMANVPLK